MLHLQPGTFPCWWQWIACALIIYWESNHIRWVIQFGDFLQILVKFARRCRDCVAAWSAVTLFLSLQFRWEFRAKFNSICHHESNWVKMVVRLKDRSKVFHLRINWRPSRSSTWMETTANANRMIWGYSSTKSDFVHHPLGLHKTAVWVTCPDMTVC